MTCYIFKGSMIMTRHIFNNHVTGLANGHFTNLFFAYETVSLIALKPASISSYCFVHTQIWGMSSVFDLQK